MKQQVEEERERQIRESKDPTSALNTERNKTYDRLVLVQEHLLHHVRGLKVREGDVDFSPDITLYSNNC